MAVLTIRDEIRGASERMQQLLDTAKDEGRDLTAEEAAEFDACDRKSRALIAKDKARGLEGGFEGMLKDVKRADGAALPHARWGGAPTGPSIGEKFVASDSFRQLHAMLPGLRGPRMATVTEIELQAATPLLSPSTGWAPGIELPNQVMPAAAARVAALFAQGTVEGGSVPYVLDTTSATAASQVEGQPKKEIPPLLAEQSMPTRTIAGWSKVSDQTLEDLAGLANYINRLLSVKVLTELDRQVVAGNPAATPPELLGVTRVSGRTADYPMPASGSPADAILHQILAVEAATGFRVDAVVAAPGVYELIGTLKTTDGIYVSGQPITSTPSTLLWGRQFVISPAMAAGTALVGAFAVGGTLAWRHRLRIAVTNTDADDFQRNLSTVRVELRAALVIDVPAAFGLVTALA